MGTKVRFILPILILAGTGILNAGWVVKGGWNRSIPQSKDGEAISGITVGIGYDWRLTKKLPIYLTCDLLYSTWGATYRNKTWPTNNTDKDVVIGDIYLKVGFIEIPLQLMYVYHINKRISCSLSTGIIRNCAMTNSSKSSHLNFIDLSNEESKDFPFDYERFDEGTIRSFRKENTGFDGSLSLGLRYYRIGIKFMCIYAFHEIKSMGSLSLNEKVNTIHCMIQVNL